MFYHPVMNQPSMVFNALPERLNAAIPTNVIATSDLAALPSPTGSTNPDPLEDIRIRAVTVFRGLTTGIYRNDDYDGVRLSIRGMVSVHQPQGPG